MFKILVTARLAMERNQYLVGNVWEEKQPVICLAFTYSIDIVNHFKSIWIDTIILFTRQVR